MLVSKLPSYSQSLDVPSLTRSTALMCIKAVCSESSVPRLYKSLLRSQNNSEL